MVKSKYYNHMPKRTRKKGIFIEVTKKYGKTLACDNVSFQVDDGSITVLLGPNGAGKSTIIKSLIGFLRFDGQIEIDGFPCKSIAAKRLLGYVPEIPALYQI